MTKYVKETPAAHKTGVQIIMRGRRHVATIQAHYGPSRVLINAWAGDALARDKNQRTADKIGLRGFDPYEVQIGRAFGGGYDKYTAALAGLIIDGHVLVDHCEERKLPPKGEPCFPEDYKPPKGWTMANWGKLIQHPELGLVPSYHDKTLPVVRSGFASCYKLPGTDYLRALGYNVINGI